MVNWKDALSNGFHTSDHQNSLRPDTRPPPTFIHSHDGVLMQITIRSKLTRLAVRPAQAQSRARTLSSEKRNSLLHYFKVRKSSRGSFIPPPAPFAPPHMSPDDCRAGKSSHRSVTIVDDLTLKHSVSLVTCARVTVGTVRSETNRDFAGVQRYAFLQCQ